MLPYPHMPEQFRTAFCFRENACVRMKHECWSCSWRQPGSEALAIEAAEAQHCAVFELKARNRHESLLAPRRAA